MTAVAETGDAEADAEAREAAITWATTFTEAE
jgi:hypothetical protein